jgi:hypothetical protein
MSRLTGTDALGLFEAYQTIYSPQELTEEQVWEEVENWVNSLLEEGYDLSDYTWEEMYEAYLAEIPGVSIGPGGINIKGKPVKDTPSTVFTKPSKPLPPLGSKGSGFEDKKPPFTAVTLPDLPRASAPAKPSAAPARPAAAPARPAAAPARPAAAPARPAVSAKPAATAKPNNALSSATAAASKPTAFSPNPLMKDMPKRSSSTNSSGGEQAMSKLPAGDYSPDSTKLMSSRTKNILGTKDSETGKVTRKPADFRTAREKMLNQSFDLFDVIKGYLLDEGYADTEESALAIMANMSEEWKQSIVESKNA